MGYVNKSWKILAITFGNIFRKPVTVEFPDVIRPRAPRLRGSFALRYDENGEELCIGCLQCERICPSGVITVVAGPKRVSEFSGKKRGYNDDFMLDLQACIICELCVQVCPTDAIVMIREQEAPVFSREELLLTKSRLHANADKALAWASGSVLMEMQDPKRGQPKKVKKVRPKKAAPKPAAAKAEPAAEKAEELATAKAEPAAEKPAAEKAPVAEKAEKPAAEKAPVAEAAEEKPATKEAEKPATKEDA